MSADLRLPNITALDDRGKIQQIQSYLYQLVQQLNWAMQTMDTAQDTQVATGLVNTSGNTLQVSQQQKQDPESTFNSIKSLIIKSADIINAYYEVFKKRFDGSYVAQSEFGTYTEETSNLLEVTSTAISQLYTNIQSITDTLDGLYDSLIESQAWIKSGLLDYKSDGTPIYGIEVGQRDEIDGAEVFNRYARFTAEGIYFYLPAVASPIAWMSGEKLHITNAEISGKLILNGYELDLSNGIAFRWIGG